jgi:hypothetical protein
MLGATPRLDSIVAGTQGFVDESALIAAGTGNFITSIVGRAPIPDIANDLKASLGIERIPVQQIIPIQNEFGAGGEPVYGALNDTRGLIRFVGSWTTYNDIHGVRAGASASGDYVEITFYGTGLNIISAAVATQDVRCTVDGGSEGSNFVPQGSSILLSRKYAANQVYPATTIPLSLGIHTIKLRMANANGFSVFGFEVLNNNSSGLININPGVANNKGAKYTNSIARSIAYNQNQAGSTVVTGVKGGRIVRYISANDTIGTLWKEVPTGDPLYLTSAVHTDEEVARTYFWREFGAGRYTEADDFSLLPSSPGSERVFTLEDDSATLLAHAVLILIIGSVTDTLSPFATNSFVTLTFTGTGLDIVRQDGGSGGASSVYTLYVDGVSRGTLNSTGSTSARVEKLVSNLPYGTHTVQILATSVVTYNFGIKQFIVYQPKKPSLPTGAVELTDYNVLAAYSPVGTVGPGKISTGTSRKYCAREFVYVGAGSFSGVDTTNFDAGRCVGSAVSGDYTEYTLFGSGLDIGMFFTAAAANATISITNVATGAVLNLSSYTTALVQTGGLTWTASTGALAGTSLSGKAKLEISGLPLAVYKLKILQNTTTQLYLDYIDIITPIHTHKSNLYGVLQNTLPVGSTSLLDTRMTSYAQTQKAWAQAVGVYSTPSTATAVFLPLVDMSVTIKTEGGPLLITFFVDANNSGAGAGQFAIYMDGVILPNIIRMTNASSLPANLTMTVPAAKGVHKIDAFFYCNGGTYYAVSTDRILTVREL